MKGERDRDRVMVCRRVRADLLVLAHVGRHRRRRRHERPQLRDLLPPLVQEPRADRREQPLEQARAVVVGAELVAREREVRERVRAVHEHLDA